MRVPKTFYHNKSEVSFKVKNKQIFYTIYKWNDEGINRASIHTAKYNNEDPKSLITSETNGENNGT